MRPDIEIGNTVSAAPISIATETTEQTSTTEERKSSVTTQDKDKKSTLFTIVKAVAIICVVLSHAGIRGWLFNFVFIFHVPIFFLCAGYFFHTKYLNDERTFVVHRVKGLYWPFWRWSVLILVLHNLFFLTGIQSEQYGNAINGVMHPYNWHQFGQHLWSITVNMSGYNDFLCGTFWFFRALLLASIAFLILFKIFRKSEYFKDNISVGWGILITASILTYWKVADGLSVTGVAQGGYRELMGIVFMAAGFLIRQYKVAERMTWKIATPCLLLLVLASIFFPSSMAWNPSMKEFISLPFPAIAAFLALTYGCTFIDRKDNVVKRSLVYIGNNTLYIFAFHLIAFKAVSALKVAYYGLPWQMVGCHPTIFNPESNVLWIVLYTLAGIGLPLLWMVGYRHISSLVNITEKKTVETLIISSQRFVKIAANVGKAIGIIFMGACHSIWQGIKDIIAASSTKEE